MKWHSIQVLRAIAALAVLACHSFSIKVGAAGVDLFFVISGFIIATVAPGRSAWPFIKARFRRIFPIYWANMAPWIVVAVEIGAFNWTQLASSITLWPIYLDYQRPFLPAGWSLSYELLFYAAAALTLRFGPWPAAIIYLVALVFDFVIGSPLTSFVGNVIAFEFLAGVAIARVTFHLPIWTLIPAAVLLIYSPDLSQIVVEQSPERLLWWGLPAVILFKIALQNEDLFRRKEWRPLTFLGDASYSIYLCHQFVLLFVTGLWGFLCALGIGCLMHVYIERPMLAKPRNQSEAA